MLPADPDASAAGFLGGLPNPQRYGSQQVDPFEAPGIIRRLMPEHARVLDIGCGAGDLTVAVTHGKDNEVVGIEAHAGRAAAAAERGLDVVAGFAEGPVVKRLGLFDVVLMVDVLEHLAAPADLLDLASNALAPGGRIIASVPNVAHWTVRARLLLGRWEYQPLGIMDATHLRWFTRASLKRFFESRSLNVIAIEAAAGAWMPEYRKAFGLIPNGVRRAMLARAARAMPTWFASQFVVVATKA